MKVFERWRESTRTTQGFFIEEAAATWDVLLDFQEATGITGMLGGIGVWYAKSASLLAMHTRNEERLALVDQSIQPEARALLEPFTPAGNVSYLEMRSSRLAGSAETARWPRAFRWIHVDGEHTGQALANDLHLCNLWLRRIM